MFYEQQTNDSLKQSIDLSGISIIQLVKTHNNLMTISTKTTEITLKFYCILYLLRFYAKIYFIIRVKYISLFKCQP